MNDIDYGYTKIFNMMIQNQGEYPRYSPDSKYVDICTLSSGLTDATRNQHTLTGTTTSSPSRELLIKISTIGKEPEGTIYYPTVVKIGVTIDDVDDVDSQYFDETFYEQFMWFDMMPIDNHTYGIYLNDLFGNYMKAGIKNHVHFVYRVFDNSGNEYRHSNPHYTSASLHSVWTIDVYKVTLSRYREPTNVDLLLDGYNQYIGPSDIAACRTITTTINQTTLLPADTTPLGRFEAESGVTWTRSNSEFVVSQFEMVNMIVNLSDYWKDTFDYCVARMYITDPEGNEHAFYLKPSNSKPGKYNLNFRICDLSANKMFQVDSVNRYVNIQFGITPKRHGILEPETVIPTEVTLTLVQTPDEVFDPEDLGVFLSKTANY